MRVIALVPAFFASIAFAVPPAIDLDQPGALEQLQQHHPRRFQAISALLHAWEHLPCKSSELKTLKSKFDVKDMECAVLVLTSYPPKRHVGFEFDGAKYTATVVLQDVEDGTVQPAVAVDSISRP